MTNNQQHPITPPPKLMKEWLEELDTSAPQDVLLAVVQWGADQELEACLRLVEIDAGEDAYDFARYIRAARRPKPPSLKEQALEAMRRNYNPDNSNDFAIIRRALEQLDD
jgi:hypothetical protein